MSETPTFVACPFCGRSHQLHILPQGTQYRVHCGTCSSAGPVMPSEELAAREWNRRGRGRRLGRVRQRGGRRKRSG